MSPHDMSKSSKKPKPAASIQINDASVWKKFTDVCDQKGLLYKKTAEKALAYYLEAGMPNS